ncbi:MULTISPECIES: 30S ribosomal protein S8 [Meiothermus]|uniref:Small ribosomal subunit protein uS8 n=2 Tax=Meiothermus hypogaeus TaxID=884155 RepID=A0A511R491_9DEIN|nr:MULTISPECIES: 30S ribosomal protein S8 [Meiothermus]RIH78270.1 30S ribosomal protein S8 [Meiothermus hypogaeus]GEM83836.1 30S ribosomal protein S8 [Meiothermus hypogaeus NBRC 106114]GIW34424.1 MAG: 30S ribosomal protein S8 [Meiothermus sp.]
MLSDPIADMLTRIRNGVQVYKESVDVPASKFKQQIASILVKEGFLKGVEPVEVDGKPYLRLTLKYGPRREQVIQHIQRVSRPGRRVYVTAENVPSVRRGLGLAIVSTSKGLLPDREARKLGVGGEVICEVW